MFVSIYNGRVHKFSRGFYLTFPQGFNFADGPEFSKFFLQISVQNNYK